MLFLFVTNADLVGMEVMPPLQQSGPITTVRGTEFAVDARYDVKKYIGCGSYGVVVSAVDQVDPAKSKVAIKKMSAIFKSKTTAKRSLREVRLLLHFNHENVLGIRDLMGSPDCSDLYVVTDLMDVDLGKVIRSPQPLSERHVQFFLYQLLRGVRYLHACNTLHRDLKPCNILVNANCDLKISDFGLSRGVSTEEGVDDCLTEYVVTRWYRAPEIVLASEFYTKAVDMWSVGCIFAELLGRKPLFPGKDHVDQLRKTIDVIGTPLLEAGTMSHIPDKARRFLAGVPRRMAKPFSSIYPDASGDAIALLNSLLTWEPSRRVTAPGALAHTYLARFYDPAKDAEEPSTSASFAEGASHSVAGTREALFAELCRFRPDLDRLQWQPEERHQRLAVTSPPTTPAAATGTKRTRYALADSSNHTPSKAQHLDN